MKRTLFVLVLVLILTVCFVGEAFALNHPWRDTSTDPGGEDYPWGGDESVSGPILTSVKTVNQISFTTGIMAVDIIFKYFILDEFNVIEKSSSAVQVYKTRRIPYQKYSTVNREGIRK